MTDWTDGPPEVVRVLRERALTDEELRADAARLGWTPASGRKRLVGQANGRRAMEWRWREEAD